MKEGMTEWLKVADCKSVSKAYVGSNPTSFSLDRKNRTRTRNRWFWKPLFYQLNYFPRKTKLGKNRTYNFTVMSGIFYH